jgi:hypothetical protein
VRVDDVPLPGDAAQLERRSEPLAEPGYGKRADHVPAPADPEHERAVRAGDQLIR